MLSGRAVPGARPDPQRAHGALQLTEASRSVLRGERSERGERYKLYRTTS